MSKRKVGPGKKAKPPNNPKKNPAPTAPWWKRHWKAVLTIGGLIGAAVGFASALVTFFPRLQIDVSEQFDPASPLPSSATIRNQLIPLKEVAFSVRICQATDTTGQGHIIGLKSCSGISKGGGGITMPQWQGHSLRTDETWTLVLGSGVPFLFNTGNADIRLVVQYWPQYLPHPWFIAPGEKEARLTTLKKPDGQTIWGTEPID